MTEPLRPRVELLTDHDPAMRFNLRYSCGCTAANIALGLTGPKPKSAAEWQDRTVDEAVRTVGRPCFDCRRRETNEYAAAAERQLAAALPLAALDPWHLVKGE